MNKDKSSERYLYRKLRNSILTRTVLVGFASVIILYISYSLFLKGNISVFVVNILQAILGIDYYQAIDIYDRVFRSNIMFFVIVSWAIVFFILFKLYIDWLMKYFSKINNGIDTLINENSDDVSLPLELSATEKKLNEIKHTLERQKLDLKLEEQRKNDMIVYLAHDLKTPLTSVIGYLTLLRDESEISTQNREKYTNIALEKSERLEDLINEFFDITRFSLTHLSLETESVSLTRMLEQITYEFNPIINEKSLVWNLQLESNVNIICDIDKLQRVFDNLIRNAVNYSYQESAILVKLTSNNENAIVEITNRGKTISAEKLEHIFKQFFRTDYSRATATGGAGLGLAIAKEIVELHKGCITVESADESIKFTVQLPIDCNKIV